jgi:hypothetical protein
VYISTRIVLAPRNCAWAPCIETEHLMRWPIPLMATLLFCKVDRCRTASLRPVQPVMEWSQE